MSDFNPDYFDLGTPDIGWDLDRLGTDPPTNEPSLRPSPGPTNEPTLEPTVSNLLFLVFNSLSCLLIFN